MDSLDRRRFRAVFDDGFPEIYRYLLRRVGDRGAAEDVVQETFAAALRKVEDGGIEEVTMAWLHGVARHKLADHWRRQERENRRVERWGADQRGAVVEAGPGERVLAALEELPVPQRAALVLHYLDDVPVQEVAAMLGRSTSATESLLARARHAFRGAYGREHVDA